jgi:hypothetical protein
MRILLASIAFLAIPSLVLAQPAKKTPEQLLSANCLAYFRYDGYEPHKKAYDQTALAKIMKEGLGEFFDHFFTQMIALGGEFPPRRKEKDNKQAPDMDLKGALDYVSTHGFVIGLDIAPPGPAFARGEDLYHLTVVFPQGAQKPFRPALENLFRAAARALEVQIDEEKRAGRDVKSMAAGDEHIAWWAEGDHLICSVGANAFERSLRVIDGKKPNLTAAKWHAEFARFNRYETDMRGYVNLAGIVDRIAMLGLEEPSLENFKSRFERQVILAHLGLTGVNDLQFHLGFDGKFQRSTVRLGVVGPERRTGLLRLMSGPIGYGLDKLPPLPPDADYVNVRHVDWAGVEDYVRTSYGLLAVSNMLKGELPPRFPDLNRLIGGDFRKDFIDQLDNTVVCYGGHSEGPFFLGQGFALKVKDAAKVKKGLQAIAKDLGEREEMLRPEKKQFRGEEMHVFSRLPLPVTYAVHNDWLVFGLFPQPVQGFILRSGGKYKSWQIPPEAKEALAKENNNGKSKLLGVSVVDPRPALQLGLSVLPGLVQMVNLSLGTSKFLDVDKIPNSQTVNEWAFPNTAFLYDDGNALRWENHYSINEPDDIVLLPFVSQFGLMIPFSLPAPRPKVPPVRAAGLGGGAGANPLVRVEKPLDAMASAVEKDGVVEISAIVNRPVTENRVKKVAKTVNKTVRENGKERVVAETVYVDLPYQVTRNVPEQRTLIADGKKVQVTRKDGAQVDVKELPKLLEKKSGVLLVTGEKVDEATLRRLDEETLIIRVTPSEPPPPPAFPGPAK